MSKRRIALIVFTFADTTGQFATLAGAAGWTDFAAPVGIVSVFAPEEKLLATAPDAIIRHMGELPAALARFDHATSE